MDTPGAASLMAIIDRGRMLRARGTARRCTQGTTPAAGRGALARACDRSIDDTVHGRSSRV